MSFLEEDIEKCKIYNEFYSKNPDLFKKNAVEYWRLCKRYYENIKRSEKQIKNPIRIEDFIEIEQLFFFFFFLSSLRFCFFNL
jgi:hypothetical protein